MFIVEVKCDLNYCFYYRGDVESKLERLRSEETPAASWLPILLSHIGSQVKKLIDLELKTLQSGHDFQSQGRMT